MLYTKLNEGFDNTDGALRQYAYPNPITAFTPIPHYNIRTFNNTDLTVPYFMLDMKYWNSFHFTGVTMGEFASGRTIVQNEQWTSDGSVGIGKDATNNYSNLISTTIAGSTNRKLESHYIDDLLTGFNDGGRTYYIQVLLRGFPAQAATVHLDLTNSLLVFSNTDGFTGGTFVNVPFSSSINSLTAGGDLLFKFNRNLLNALDLTNIKAIKFYLVTLGPGGSNMVFKAQDMKLISDLYTTDNVEIDTKHKQLVRVYDSAGVPVTQAAKVLYFEKTHPKNITLRARFNSGHIPTSMGGTSEFPTGSNNIRFRFRANDAGNTYITVLLSSITTLTKIRVFETVNGVSNEIPTLLDSLPLAPETEYVLEAELINDKINIQIFNVDGSFITDFLSYYNTTVSLGSIFTKGSVGYSLEPFNFDFTLRYITSPNAEFAHLETSSLTSDSPVVGATLWANNSSPINLHEGNTFVVSGDCTLSNVTFANKQAQKITRDGTNWFGGVQSNVIFNIGNPNQTFIEGYIYPITYNGYYRIVLQDQYGTVVFLKKLRNLIINQWNFIKVPISYIEVAPNSLKLFIQQTGFYNDVTYVSNIKVNHNTIAWEASINGGTTWQPFLNSLNDPYTGLEFQSKGNKLKIKATAYSDTAWVLPDYKLKPIYNNIGHTLYDKSSKNVNIRVVGKNTSISAADIRIIGV